MFFKLARSAMVIFFFSGFTAERLFFRRGFGRYSMVDGGVWGLWSVATVCTALVYGVDASLHFTRRGSLQFGFCTHFREVKLFLYDDTGTGTFYRNSLPAFFPPSIVSDGR
jgi:hypothetical protein